MTVHDDLAKIRRAVDKLIADPQQIWLGSALPQVGAGLGFGHFSLHSFGDTGAYASGHLTCIILEGDKRRFMTT
jgi:hypothetical protein